jgi:REP element-mobilizing transposase RayT
MGRGVPSLRSQACLRVLRKAFSGGRDRWGFRLVHYAVQAGHVHLLVEAPERRVLARGVQGLCVRVARGLNRQLKRCGRVFADRYHARPLRTPREVRHALAYVLLQARRHGARQRVGISTALDPCSSAGCFDGWSRGPGPRAGPWQDTVVEPGTWLLRLGWRRHGLIDPAEVPGASPSS